MASNPHIAFMKKALDLAQYAASIDEIPVGAVIVYQNRIIGAGYNNREKAQNPLGHAELRAIANAAKALSQWRLLDAILYVTLEPCVMCLGAIVHARIKTVVYGCQDPKAGADSLFQISRDPRLNHRLQVVSGILETECRDLLQSFFKKLRRNRME